VRRALRALAVAVVIHGALFALSVTAFARTENAMLGEAFFLLLVSPALMLAMPLTPLLWPLHLMEAPGWFAWPTPLGFVLVYFIWVAALFALSFAFRRPA
jgi:hypothetical protein